MLPLIVVAAFMIFLSVLLIVVGIASPRPADDVEARLVEYGGRPLTLEEIELSQPFGQRILVPMINASAGFASRFTPQRTMESTRHKLEMAGNPNNWTPAQFVGMRGLAALLLGGLTFVVTMLSTAAPLQRIGIVLVMTLIGFVLPGYWLGTRIKRRKNEIVKTLPDAIDLLTISVEAGLPFDGAMQRVADKWDNEISRAFGRVLTELRVGKSRRDALHDMSVRADVPDVTSFIAALIQADTLGISIAKVLRIQSEQMRIKRRQRAEEKAHQAPVKMLIPMTFLIFPSIWIVILGPAIIILKKLAHIRRDMRLGNAVADLLFPPRCVACHRLGAWLCAGCLADIQLMRPPVCAHCGIALSPDDGNITPVPAQSREAAKDVTMLCTQCRKAPFQLDGLRACAFHSGPLRKAIHQFKYEGLRSLAAPLGQLMSQAWSELAPDRRL